MIQSVKYLVTTKNLIKYKEKYLSYNFFEILKQDRWMLLIPIIVVQKPDYSDIEKKYTDYQRIMTSVDKSEFRK